MKNFANVETSFRRDIAAWLIRQSIIALCDRGQPKHYRWGQRLTAINCERTQGKIDNRKKNDFIVRIDITNQPDVEHRNLHCKRDVTGLDIARWNGSVHGHQFPDQFPLAELDVGNYGPSGIEPEGKGGSHVRTHHNRND